VTARVCVDCGAPVRPRDRDRCSRCHRRAEPTRACASCGRLRLIAGRGLCESCWQRDPDRLFRQTERIAARLEHSPVWLADFAAHAAARHCVGRSSLMIGRLGRILTEPGPTNPQALLERVRQPGRSMGALARTLEDFFVDAGLAFPLDHAAQLSAGRRRRRVEGTPELLRPAVARFADALIAGQQRARRAGTRPRGERTIEDDIAIVRDLARFLIAERAKTDWASTDAGDVEAFLTERPLSRARRLSALRGFFRWAKANRFVLVDPTKTISARRPRAPRSTILTLAQQRRLFRRWTTHPDAHPHECLVGLLALLHAASSMELRGLKVSDVDAARRAIRLGRRPHPVPLDPATWTALQRCLEHREQLATHNPHVIVTYLTKTRSTPASDQYLVRVLDPAGISSRPLRATRLVDLIASLDPKLVCEAIGMNTAGVLPYAADQVQDVRLANL
jgi:site-specific recombinase XerD